MAATAISKAPTAPGKMSDPSHAKKSSIIKSSFAPSSLQLHLFASVIQSFDHQQLRIHDTSTGRLRQQHSARPGNTITSLDWGHYGGSIRDNGSISSNKKRKRAQKTEDIVLAYGTSTSEVCMYSPSEGRLVGTLSGAHEGGIRDFKFSPNNNLEAWSIGGDGQLIQWDLANNQAIKKMSLPDSRIGILSKPSQAEPQLLCASTTPFSISPTEGSHIGSFDSFKGPVHSLERSGRGNVHSSELFLAADHDRYINVFDIEQRKLVRTLVVGSGVEQLDLYSPSDLSGTQLQQQLLAVVTKDGVVELFSHPFKLPVPLNGDLKSKRKDGTRKANAYIKLTGADKNASKIFAASLQGPDLLIVSVDGGVDPVFQKIRWQDEGSSELLFEGTKEVLKTKIASVLNTAQMNGVKDMGKTHVDESRTVVVNGTGDLTSHDAIEISSGDEADDDDDDDDAESEVGAQFEAAAQSDASANESDDDTSEIERAVTTAAGNEDIAIEEVRDQEPSFGDIVASKYPNTIVIADSFPPENSAVDLGRQVTLSSRMSLGTVLTQALRTNDTNLLESCLHANDAGIIQNTIQRVDSILAAALLSKLAERLASRPGRYGHLLSWVQWTCVAHGGALASQSGITVRIRTLYRVLTQRSRTLDHLLILKGKLDMLHALWTFRKQIQSQQKTTRRSQGEAGMIYIEGEEDNWSSDEDVNEAIGLVKKSKNKRRSRRALEDLVQLGASSEDDDDEEMPIVNGVASEDSDNAEESDEEAEMMSRTKGDIYDIEAGVSGEEDEADESEDGEDSDEDDDDDDDNSEMDSFIDDSEIPFASEEDETDLDDEPGIRQPEKKRSKH